MSISVIPGKAVDVPWKREREAEVAFWWSNAIDLDATSYPRHLLAPSRLYLKAKQLLIRCPEGTILIQGAQVGALFKDWCKGEATHIKKGEGIDLVVLVLPTKASEDQEENKKALPRRTPQKKEENDEKDFA